MEKLYEMKAPVIAYAYMLFDRFGRRADWYWDWKPELERTREAIAHVEAALNEPDCSTESRPILERFWKCLNAGKHFAEIRLEFQELVLLAAEAASTPEDCGKQGRDRGKTNPGHGGIPEGTTSPTIGPRPWAATS